MQNRIIPNDKEKGNQIRERRIELYLTVEQAARLAEIAPGTWRKYEAGNPIREDKFYSICRVLRWTGFPAGEEENDEFMIIRKEYRKREAWSPWLEKNFGAGAAFAFCYGSDILLDGLNQDLQELSSMPRGSCVEDLDFSLIYDYLPQQFLDRYDCDFLSGFRERVCQLRRMAKEGVPMTAHSVRDELIFYLCNRYAAETMGMLDPYMDEFAFAQEYDEEWIYDFFDDMDIKVCLYSDRGVPESSIYHFDNWNQEAFFIHSDSSVCDKDQQAGKDSEPKGESGRVQCGQALRVSD